MLISNHPCLAFCMLVRCPQSLHSSLFKLVLSNAQSHSLPHLPYKNKLIPPYTLNFKQFTTLYKCENQASIRPDILPLPVTKFSFPPFSHSSEFPATSKHYSHNRQINICTVRHRQLIQQTIGQTDELTANFN